MVSLEDTMKRLIGYSFATLGCLTVAVVPACADLINLANKIKDLLEHRKPVDENSAKLKVVDKVENLLNARCEGLMRNTGCKEEVSVSNITITPIRPTDNIKLNPTRTTSGNAGETHVGSYNCETAEVDKNVTLGTTQTITTTWTFTQQYSLMTGAQIGISTSAVSPVTLSTTLTIQGTKTDINADTKTVTSTTNGTIQQPIKTKQLSRYEIHNTSNEMISTYAVTVDATLDAEIKSYEHGKRHLSELFEEKDRLISFKGEVTKTVSTGVLDFPKTDTFADQAACEVAKAKEEGTSRN
jgi:hypothetical protein